MKNNDHQMVQSQQRCVYCGASLNPAYYFCIACATPYRDVEQVLSAPISWPESESKIIRKQVPQVWYIFWTYAAILFFVIVLNVFLAEGRSTVPSALIVGSILIGGATIVFSVIYWKSLRVQLGRTGFEHPASWLGLAALIPLLAVNFTYHTLIIKIGGVEIATRGLSEQLSFGAMVVLIAIVPAITEELAFRGLIQHWLQTVVSPWRAILLTAALFSALHLSILSAPYLFLLGLLLGWVKWKTGSLYPVILIHMVHNLVVLIVS